MTDITQLQAQVAVDQASLQQANDNLTAANAAAGTAVANGASPSQISQAQLNVSIATQSQQVAQSNLLTSQSALDLATAQLNPEPPLPSNVVPENSLPPVTIDPSNGQSVTNYTTASSSTLTSEVVSKVATTGLSLVIPNITQGIKLGSSPTGMVTVVNTSTGKTVQQLSVTVNPGTNSLPPNTIPTSKTDNTQMYKVTISQEPKLTGDAAALITNNQVVFDVMPAISETGEASYKSFTPIQHPGEILKYDGSASRNWGITAKLVSRNVADADRNLAYINLIRSWRMPFYGTGTGTPSTQTAEFLGAPPPVLTLTAYGAQMIGPVKCVMTQYSWNWPNDIDYIHTSSGVPFPVIIDVSMSLKESYSPAEYSQFNLLQFRNGNLPAAFGGASSSQMSALGQNTPAAPGAPISPTTPTNASSIQTSQANTATIGQVTSASGTQQSSVQSAAGGTSSFPTLSQVQGAKAIQDVSGQN